MITGAVVLPYLAVVIANSGGSRKGEAPTDVRPQPVAALPASGTALEGVVIVPEDHAGVGFSGNDRGDTGDHDPHEWPQTSKVE